MVNIEQLLPQDIYDAAVGGASPSSSNVFATIADLTALTPDNFANADLTFTGERFHDGDGHNFSLLNVEEYELESNDSMLMTAGTHMELVAADGLFLIQAAGAGYDIELRTTTQGAVIMPLVASPTATVTTPVEGMLKGNSTSNELEYYNGSAWVGLGGAVAQDLNAVTTVGNNTLGNDIILDPSAPATAGAVNNSPILYIRGNYDSDSGAPVVSTDIDTTFQTTISTFGALNSGLTIEHGGAEIYNYRVHPTGGQGASHTWTATNDDGIENIDMSIQSGGEQHFILNGENANYSNQFIIDLTTEVPSLQIIGDSGYNGTLTSAVLDDDRTWTLPDATGTVALTSQLTGNGMFDVANNGGTWNATSATLSATTTITGAGNELRFTGMSSFLAIADSIIGTSTAGTNFINSGTGSLQFTQTGTGDIRLLTSGGAGSGEIDITSGTGNINISAGTGRVLIEGLTYPNVDGAPNQVLETNGGGVLSWVTPSSGNTLYSADDTVGAGRVATLTDSLTFEDGHVIIDGGAGTGFLATVKRDFDAGVGGRGTSQTINSYGSDVRTVRTNGTALQIWNEWTIGSSRKSFDFIASVNNNYFSIFQSTNGTTENVRIGEIGSWWNPRNTTAFGFGFGHTSPLAGTVHVDNMDFRVEGAGSTLLFADYSSNGVGIGTTNPTGYRLLVKGGDVAFEGASLSNEFLFDYSANNLTIGAGAAGTNKFNVIGGVNITGNVITPNQKLNISGNTTSGTYSTFSGAVGAGAGTTQGLLLSITPLTGTYEHRNLSVSTITTNAANNYGVYSVARNGSGQTAAVYGRVVSESVGSSFGSIAIYGTNQGGAGNAHYAGRFAVSSAGTNSWGVHSEATGVGTNNYAGYFKATGATNNYAIVVPSGGGNSGFGTLTPASMVTANGDVETLGDGNGVIVADATTSTRYRIYVDNGVLSTQLA